MTSDALRRRLRFAPPQPRRGRPDLSEADYAVLDALDTHHLLDTKTIHRLTKRRHLSNLQHRLADFYHGCCEHPEHRMRVGKSGNALGFSMNEDGAPAWRHSCEPQTLVYRPEGQDLTSRANYQPCVYALTPLGRTLLPSPQPFVPRSGWFVHDFFCARITAAFQELAPAEFLSRRDLLRRVQCPERTRANRSPFVIPVAEPAVPKATAVVPDDLFGLQYAGGGFRYFVVEADRYHERRSNAAKDSIERKLRLYQRIMSDGVHFDVFGIKNLTVLMPTTSDGAVRNFVHQVNAIVEERWHRRFLTKTYPQFGTRWSIPDDALDVLTPWESAAGPVDVSKRTAA